MGEGGGGKANEALLTLGTYIQGTKLASFNFLDKILCKGTTSGLNCNVIGDYYTNSLRLLMHLDLYGESYR